MSGYSELATDSFELKRVMRQEAHEKAFEIRVMSQRMFEKEKANIVREGRKRVEQNVEKMRRELMTEMNIKRSTQINKARMKKMNVRNELMKELVQETLNRMREKLADPKNPEYREVLKKLVIQGMIKLLEKKVIVKCRKKDLDLVKDMVEEVQDAYAEHMRTETDSDTYTCQVEVMEENFIKEDSQAGKCGGIVLCSQDKLIVCSNTLDERLNLCYEESLPVLRNMLFPK